MKKRHIFGEYLIWVKIPYPFWLQATYDPSHGYSPQPIDISGMTLSRELQVCIFLSIFHSTPDFSVCQGFIMNKLIWLPFACSLWQSNWLRTITTPGGGRRNWSSKLKVTTDYTSSLLSWAAVVFRPLYPKMTWASVRWWHPPFACALWHLDG